MFDPQKQTESRGYQGGTHFHFSLNIIMSYYSSDQRQLIQASELEHIQIALTKEKQSMLTERELSIYQYLMATKVLLFNLRFSV